MCVSEMIFSTLPAVIGPGKESSGVPVGGVVGGVLGLFVVFCLVSAFLLWKRREQFAFLDKFRVKKEQGTNC